MRKSPIVLCTLFLLLTAAGCSADLKPLSGQAFALDTIVSVSLYDHKEQAVLDHALSLCTQYEKLLSRTLPESDVSRINAHPGSSVAVDPRTAQLIQKGLEFGKLSDGAFDITIAPVSSLWDFKSEKPSPPAPEAIAQAIKKVDYTRVHVEGSTVTLPEDGEGLDLGGIAKGYIADRIAEYLRAQGVKSAIVDLGGNIYALGQKPDGTDWRVGIQSPFKQRGADIIGFVRVKNKSVVTSGVYERYFEKDGRLYHHILDSKTGYPVDNGLLSVTILSDLSVDGDALSTSVFALGLTKGLELVNSMDGVQAIFVETDGTVTCSDGVTLEAAD